MINTIIIDDEPKVQKSIEMIINQYCPKLNVVGMASSALEGIKEINCKKPDLVLIDIEMPHGTGFDLLESIKNPEFQIIFITAYNQYAVKAFKYSAVDYLLKPIDIEEFVSAINRVEKNIQSPAFQKYNVLLENIKNNNLSKIAIPTSDGLEYIQVNKIMYLEAERSYCYIYMENDKKMLVSRSLSDIEKLIESESFFRCHKSFLVNLEYVKKYVRFDGGYILLNNSKRIDLSRRKKDEFTEVMKKYMKS
ncbi:MAG: hypothetical protein A2046_12505 [Bacteroidetes bacterium GWA2_30_7]|nr:MAG: hypothetical protein A2046_12505 [Bacteroidetes bacterium GWA2_30_7]